MNDMASMIENIVISTPYRENAVVAIAKASSAQRLLKCFYTTLYLASFQERVKNVPVIGSKLAREFGRRRFFGLSSTQVESVASLSELIHVGFHRLFGRYWPGTSAPLMYRAKAIFDRAVARRLRLTTPAVMIGMYGASLDSFRAVQKSECLTVLNFVNSHPAEHNRYLFELAGLQSPHHELIPDWVARRVEAELELADLVLVPSRFVAEQLNRYGVSSEKVVTLPYGVDLTAFYPRRIKDVQEDGLECLYVGQMSHRKGIRVLLDAARACDNLPVRFRLIGPIVSPEVLNDLPANVIYEGPSLPGGVAEAMRQADIFILPTLEDACALVVLEAMASGLPVVTTINNGSGELIENGVDGLIVPPGDSVALAEAIGRLVEQPELRVQLGDAARKKVQRAHSWDAYGQGVLKAIDERRQTVTRQRQDVAWAEE